jgi:hypothetical protein
MDYYSTQPGVPYGHSFCQKIPKITKFSAIIEDPKHPQVVQEKQALDCLRQIARFVRMIGSYSAISPFFVMERTL